MTGPVRWRNGSQVGRTLYRCVGDDDVKGVLVGMVDTPEMAVLVCAAVNAYLTEHPEADQAPPAQEGN